MKTGSLISCFFQDSHSCCCQRGAVRVRGKYVIKKKKEKILKTGGHEQLIAANI